MFNEDNDQDDDDNDGDLLDDDDDDEDVDDRPSLRFNSKYSTTTSNNNKTTTTSNSNLMPTIDADTRIKLEALLANAGKIPISLSLSFFLFKLFLELSRKFFGR